MGCAAARPCPRSRARAGASTGQRHFRAYRGWYPMPGPTHDVHAAGIVEETGRSWVGGPAYSGFSVAFAHHAKEVTRATLDRCANPTSRGVSMSGETPGIAVLRTPTRRGALPPGPPRIFSKQRSPGRGRDRLQPFTAPAVRPLTIWRWNIMTSKNRGAVIETAAATASTWSVVVVSRLK